jgi:hypothetical protein
MTCQDDLMEFRAAMERLEKDRSLEKGIVQDRLKENEKAKGIPPNHEPCATLTNCSPLLNLQ